MASDEMFLDVKGMAKPKMCKNNNKNNNNSKLGGINLTQQTTL